MKRRTINNNMISNLYDNHFYPTDLLSIMILILYLPIGVILLLIRLIAIIIILTFLNQKNTKFKSFLKLLCFILGLLPKFDKSAGNKFTGSKQTIFISNHITCFDFLLLKSLINDLSLFKNNFDFERSKNFGFLNKILFLNSINSTNKKNDDQPLCAFPEYERTNGKYGLLEFNEEIFEYILINKQAGKMVPICLNVNYFMLPFGVNYKRSSPVFQFFCALFVPAVSYKVEFLEAVKLNYDENLTSSNLAKQMQAKIGTALNLKCTSLTVDMVNGRNPSIIMDNDYELNKIAKQIMDVLPDTSIEAIKDHIKQSQTLDIDSLINGLLEKSSNIPKEPVIRKPVEKPVIAKNKSLTYIERKYVLIEEARKRFIMKESLRNSI